MLKLYFLLITLLISVQSQKVEVYLTTSNLTSKLEVLPTEEFASLSENQNVTYNIGVSESTKYQQMDGFGAAWTDTASQVFGKHLSDAGKEEVIEQLFGESGIGLSMIRQTIASCDFSTKYYQYDTDGGDTNLTDFSIDHDKDYIIPAVQQSLAKNPSLKVMASPWSPPAWMKGDDSTMIVGWLKEKYYQAYADYLVKWAQEYEKAKIPIYMMTVQNEPLSFQVTYPNNYMTAKAQKNLFANFIGPAFEEAGLDTKLACYDHNWDNTKYATTILSSDDSAKYVAGSAWHWYGGEPSAMTDIHNAFPDKDIWFTEGGSGTWDKDIWGTQTKALIQNPRNWAKSTIWWNMVLNQKGGPVLLNLGTKDTSLVTINDKSTDDVTYNMDYYTMGHFSKFVKTGAYRVDSDWVEGQNGICCF